MLGRSTTPDRSATPIAEFAELNRRRVFGRPGLSIREVERWQELREVLSREFGDPMPGADYEGEERRHHVRHPTHIRVVVNDHAAGIAMDVSLGGVFIATPRPLPVGSEISLELEIPERRELAEIRGRVVRVEGGGTLSVRTGMGIMFEGLDAEQGNLLRRICRGVESGA